MMPRDIAVLVKRLLTNLQLLIDEQQKQIESISRYAEANQRPQEATPARPLERVRNEVDFPPEVTERYYSEQDKSHRLQRQVFWVSVLTFVARVAYTIVTYRQ